MANSGQSLQAGSPSACVSSSAAGFRSKVQSAAVVNKDLAVSDARPYQIPSHSMHHEIRTYAELQQHMRDALREQHPEWVEPDGDSPTCRSYERRFAELLALFAKSGTQPLKSNSIWVNLPRRRYGEQQEVELFKRLGHSRQKSTVFPTLHWRYSGLPVRTFIISLQDKFTKKNIELSQRESPFAS